MFGCPDGSDATTAGSMSKPIRNGGSRVYRARRVVGLRWSAAGRRNNRRPGGPMVVTQFALNVRTNLATALTRQEGQGMVEYALIIALVAIGVSVAITPRRRRLPPAFTHLSNNLS